MDVPASDRCVPAVSGFGLTRIDQCERLTAPTPFRYPFLKNTGRNQKRAGFLWSALVKGPDEARDIVSLISVVMTLASGFVEWVQG